MTEIDLERERVSRMKNLCTQEWTVIKMSMFAYLSLLYENSREVCKWTYGWLGLVWHIWRPKINIHTRSLTCLVHIHIHIHTHAQLFQTNLLSSIAFAFLTYNSHANGALHIGENVKGSCTRTQIHRDLPRR